MIEYELTEEEVKMIENYRKKLKLDEKKVDKEIEKFINYSNKSYQAAVKLYDLCETNSNAKEYIESQLKMDYVRDVYEVGKEYEEN